MPTFDIYCFTNPMVESKRRQAWERHYQQKGCTPTKARDVAWKKCRNSTTWPPSL